MLVRQLSNEFLALLRERASEAMREADALTAAMAPLSLPIHRWEPLASCPDAGVDVDYEVIDRTFVLSMAKEDLKLALHRSQDGQVGFEVRVIRACPGCSASVPFDPPAEDRLSAGRALVAGRPWAHHRCARTP
ncbi:MAG TPA: hypothetical protein VHF25_08875 [Nitriliruptorales bacterium]|nr:hypothetical protein [Nitriliruptorales bacterium]